MLSEYEHFDHLTHVHVNCTDQHFLACCVSFYVGCINFLSSWCLILIGAPCVSFFRSIPGGSPTTVRIFDLATSAEVTSLRDIHQRNINISRFANHSPHLIATSSFDGSVKLFDLRAGQVRA